MKFNPKARLDRSQMRKLGRGGSRGGGGFPMPGGAGGSGAADFLSRWVAASSA
ncbi:MAG: hypothetical protein WKF76_12650 [Nocardioidaceae bacterium]